MIGLKLYLRSDTGASFKTKQRYSYPKHNTWCHELLMRQEEALQNKHLVVSEVQLH